MLVEDLLVAIASSLALLLEKPSGAAVARTDIFEECRSAGPATTVGQRTACGKVHAWFP